MFSLMNRNHNTTFDVFLEDFVGRGSRGYGAVQPRANIDETEKGYSITVEMPGLSRSDIEVSVENDYLTVSGTRENGKTKTTYTRSWSLGENVTQEAITARYDAGLLYVEVPMVKSKKRIISVE
jgi:HSP20 family protein